MSGDHEVDVARLAEALARHRETFLVDHQSTDGLGSRPIGCTCGWVGTDTRGHLAAALLPVVDAIADERAAAELRAAAHRLDGGDEAVEVALGGAAYVHRVLCDRAHALDGAP